MLANRVSKSARHLGRWARRERVTCYRLYDRDIPEIPLAIDWYDGRLVVARWVKDDDDLRGGDWLAQMAEAARAALGVAPTDVFLKRRERRRGGQPRHAASLAAPLASTTATAPGPAPDHADDLETEDDEASARVIVTEHDLRFVVDLGRYLDTGLFLDHRPTRARVRAEAQGKRFLNLFCYTAAFTVHAGAGGAVRSTSVDLSRRYLDWAAENLALNDLDPRRHALVAADVMVWLEQARRRPERYDLAVVDPPTFSNSKRMDGVLDLQRDHVRLLGATMDLMAPGGAIYFSTNNRRFRLDELGLAADGIIAADLGERTIPPDFRDKKIHRSWLVRRRGER